MPDSSPLADASAILFQGDSITDAGRARADANPNAIWALGSGYAGMVAARLGAEHPARGLRCFNRGIGGNTVVDLIGRWGWDALQLQPALISILIGVNDCVAHVKNGHGLEAERFEMLYDHLLAYTRQRLPDVRLIIGEPFLLAAGEVAAAWQAELAPRRAIARRLAARHGAAFVPYQEVFDAALTRAPAAWWAPDGVHPSSAGHALMADALLPVLRASLDGLPRHPARRPLLRQPR